MTVDLTGNGARQVLIQSTGINVVVRAVVVFVNRGAGVPDAGNYASVSLTSTSGSSIGFVEQFTQGGGTGNLKIAGIEAFGNPGQIGIPGNEFADLIEPMTSGRSVRAVTYIQIS